MIKSTVAVPTSPEAVEVPTRAGGTWGYLDLTALGRQESWEDSPEGYPQAEPYQWWNWHDEYDTSTSDQWRSDPGRKAPADPRPRPRSRPRKPGAS